MVSYTGRILIHLDDVEYQSTLLNEVHNGRYSRHLAEKRVYDTSRRSYTGGRESKQMYENPAEVLWFVPQHKDVV